MSQASSQNLLRELIQKALPDGIGVDELLASVPVRLKREFPLAALACALAKYDGLDWDAYLSFYPDVAYSGQHPLFHYLRHGAYEKRKLFLKQSKRIPATPLVSVIITSYNNSVYLEKCIRSVTGQTLHNIEILVVDDCSTDSSRDIVSSMAAKDKRIRLISMPCRQSLHMVRKTGVMLSSGNFIMFVDSDDYLAQNACEVAFKAISNGYDIVMFNTHVVQTPYVNQEDVFHVNRFLNALPSGEYTGYDIINGAYRDRKISFTNWNKIYASNILKYAFGIMQDGQMASGQDYYEFFIIANVANNLLKISDRLYFYNFGSGVSRRDRPPEMLDRYFDLASIFHPIKDYATTHGFAYLLPDIRAHVVGACVNTLVTETPDALIGKFAHILAEKIGVEELAIECSKRYSKQWSICARLLRATERTLRCHGNPKHFGLFYYRMSTGGVETIMASIASGLLASDCKVTFFLEERSEEDKYIDPRIHVVYLPPSLGSQEDLERHIKAFSSALSHLQVDCLMYQHTQSEALLWILLLCRFKDIVSLVFHHADFSFNYMHPSRPYNLIEQTSVFACADKLLCLSQASELMYRNAGVDAECLPNPVYSAMPGGHKQGGPLTMVAMARFGDAVKHVEQTLYVLADVLEMEPDAILYMVGDFAHGNMRGTFEATVKELDLKQHLRLVGWTRETGMYLSHSHVLLSTSYWESFGLSIAEAQSSGLPCVIYDVPIVQIRDNESIISVPQGEHRQAAQEIVKLWRDPVRYEHLSHVATEAAHRYCPEEYFKKLKDIIGSVGRYSPVHYYSYRDYAEIAKWIAHYSK